MIPKLFSAGPIKLVRSHLNEYKVVDYVFEPKDYDDFYYFIKQGLLLADDPRTEKLKNIDFQYGNEDADILKRAMASKKTDVGAVNVDEIRNQLYDEYYREIQRQIENGTLEGYPSDMRAKADEYVKNKMAENFSQKTSEEVEEDITDGEEGETEEEVVDEFPDKIPEEEVFPEPTPEVIKEEKITEEEIKEDDAISVDEIFPTSVEETSSEVKEINVESSMDVSAGLK